MKFVLHTPYLINTYVLSLAIDFVEIASISFLAPILTYFILSYMYNLSLLHQKYGKKSYCEGFNVSF